MTRFNTRVGAIALTSVGLLYMILALVTGHSAVAEPPPDLRATGAGLGPWKALALLARHPGAVAVLDVRPRAQFELFHVPGSTSVPGASAKTLIERAAGRRHVLLVAAKDDRAALLVGRVKRRRPEIAAHFLRGGARSWYLALELPVPLFSNRPPPRGYALSLASIKAWLDDPRRAAGDDVTRAIESLARSAYQPDLLQGKKKPAANRKRKKISGGCG